MAEEIVFDDEVTVGIEHVFVEVGGRGRVGIDDIGSDAFPHGFLFGGEILFLEENFLAGVVLGRFLHGGEEDRVVVLLRAEFGIPFLDDEDGGLGAGVGLEDISMQADDGEDAAVFGDVFAELFVRGIVEAALRQDHGHASAGFEEVEIALDEEQVAADLGLIAAAGFFPEIILREDAGFLDVSGEGWIRHQHVEGEMVVALGIAAEFFQLLPARAVSVDPVLVLGFFFPAFPVQGVEVEHVGLAVSGDEIERARDADGAFVEVDGEDLVVDVVGAAGGFFLGGEEVAFRQARVGEDFLPDMEDAVDGESAGAGGGVDQGFGFLGIEHFHAHVDGVARGEILALFAFAGFVDQVFEGLVHDVEVRVEEFHILERGNADGEVGGGELDLGIRAEDAFPLGFGAGEEVGDLGLQLTFGVAVIAELEVAFLVAPGGHLVEELGEDELEEFLEDIDAGVGEHLVLHFEDEVLEGLALVDEFVLFDQIGDGPALGEDVGELFRGAGNARKILEIVGVLAVVVGDGIAIGPDADGCAGGIAVGLELLLAVLEPGFLDLDEHVNGTRIVLVGDGNVRALFFTTEADGVFELDAVEWVAVIEVEDAEVELTNGLLRSEFDFLFP